MEKCPLTQVVCEQPKEYCLTDGKTKCCANCVVAGEIAKQIGLIDACSGCGTTPVEFMRVKRLGCVKCYDDLGDKLLPLIRRHQDDSDTHVGKKPSSKDLEGVLEKGMAAAIADQRYEEAAVIRDRLKAHREKKSGGG